MLGNAHGGRFTCGADDAHAIGSFGHMPVDQFAQRRVIHGAIVEHGSDQGDYAARMDRCLRSCVRCAFVQKTAILT